MSVFQILREYMKQLKVLDSNILLLQANNISSLGADGSIIVIPETVIDEIDSKKSGLNELAYQAREFGRLLTRAERGPRVIERNMHIAPLLLEGVTIWVVSLSMYPKYDSLEANIVRDRKIIEVARELSIDYDVLFISNDVMCALRAESLGLSTSDLRQTDKTLFNFTKSIEVAEEVFKSLHRSSITSVDINYTNENYNYIFTCNTTSQIKLGTIKNNTIELIGKDTEKELRRQDISPINSGQLFLAKAIQDTSIDIVICEALAGSGKSLCAISNSIRLIKQGHYESLVYIRASVDDVPKEEEVGFLSGNDEKVAVYLHPLEDSLNYIIRNKFKGHRSNDEKILEGVEKLRGQCNIEGMTGLGLRGRTLDNSVILIDEVQNMSKASLQKVLTRVGKNSKVILIGSNRQIDNPYITRYNNGLSSVLTACTEHNDDINLHAVDLTKVVRGKVAEFAEKLFSI